LKDVTFKRGMFISGEIIECNISLHKAKASPDESTDKTDFAPPANCVDSKSACVAETIQYIFILGEFAHAESILALVEVKASFVTFGEVHFELEIVSVMVNELGIMEPRSKPTLDSSPSSSRTSASERS